MLIDANIFLELFLDQEKKDNCRNFLNKTVKGELNVTVSDFSIDSIILNMGHNKLETSKIKSFLHKLMSSKGIRIYSVNMTDRLNALNHMKKYNFDYEDSIILQSALSTKCKEIVSFDRHFDKVKEIRRIEP